VIFLLLLTVPGFASAQELARESLLRRPIALVLRGSVLYSGNRRSGSVSAIDLSTRTVRQEVEVAKQLSDLVPMPDGTFIATDEAAGSLIGLRRGPRSIEVAWTLPVGRSPVNVCAGGDGSWCSVSLLWPRRLVIVALSPTTRRVRNVIDLPVAPRRQCVLPDGKTLVVADSFGGNLALVDAASGRIRAVRSLQGHNIRGLTVAGNRLLISHPILEQAVSTTDSNVFWGSVIGNVLQSVSLRGLPPTEEDGPPGPSGAVPIGHWSLYALGDPGHAAGDPGDVQVTRDGVAVVALGGVNELAIGRLDDGMFRRIAVGQHPVAIALAPNGRMAYVANEFDDSISVVDLAGPKVVSTIRLGPEPPLSEADRGEILFHDARLSRDGWYSCNSCHTDGHTCGLKNDNFSDGSFGTPKRILSLMGAGRTGPWAWNGSNATLEDQIHKSILSTMQGKTSIASRENVEALAAYVRTLPPPPSLARARDQADDGAAVRGRRVFEKLDCVHCHKPPTYTSDQVYDVGLADEAGLRRFNPPSLLGVSQLPRLLHDGRAANLREVFTRFDHPDGERLPRGELDDLLAFLNSL